MKDAFDDYLKGAVMQGSDAALLKLARGHITTLNGRLATNVLEADRLRRKAQWVADLAFNKGVREAAALLAGADVSVLPAVRELLREPRHHAEFSRKRDGGE